MGGGEFGSMISEVGSVAVQPGGITCRTVCKGRVGEFHSRVLAHWCSIHEVSETAFKECVSRYEQMLSHTSGGNMKSNKGFVIGSMFIRLNE